MTFAIMLKDQIVVNKKYPGCYGRFDADHLYVIFTADSKEIASDHGYQEAWSCARWIVEHEHDWKRADMGIAPHVRRRDQIVRYVIGAAGLVALTGLIVWLVKGL